MRISDWSSACALPIYCRSTATRRAGDRALRLRRVVQVGVAGQPGFQRIVQALRLVGGQLRRRNLVAIRAAQVGDLVTDVLEHHVRSGERRVGKEWANTCRFRWLSNS